MTDVMTNRVTPLPSAMAKPALVWTWILLSISTTNPVESVIQESLTKFLGTLTNVKQVRIPELLNQLCNESQGPLQPQRDACYGCFSRANELPFGYPMLLAMSTCADTYLNDTQFQHCQQYLRNATAALSARVSPTTIYCTFLECVRQANKDTLIRECIGEAITLFPSFNNTDVQLAQLFVNTTACVLAKTRCAYVNPITGEVQEDALANKFQLPSFNAILVNSDYDINIVQLPFRYGSSDVCAKYRNIRQASWPSVSC